MADRTAWRICSGNGWWSAFGKRRRWGKGRKVGPPVHDDLVKRDFTADGPNRLWLADITEHRTAEGKLYLCAIKDVWSNRIVGYSIDSRMKSRLAVSALDNAAARRGDLAGCILHTDRGSQFRSRKFVRALDRHHMIGSMGRVGAAGDNAAMESFFGLLQNNAALEALEAHLIAKRLDSSEYERRVEACQLVRSRAELLRIFADLPVPHPELPLAVAPSSKPDDENMPALVAVGCLTLGLGLPVAVVLGFVYGAWWVLAVPVAVIVVMSYIEHLRTGPLSPAHRDGPQSLSDSDADAGPAPSR